MTKSNTLASADVKPIQEIGKAIFVNIEDEALLDLDVLMNAHWGLVDLRLGNGILLLDGTTIHVIISKEVTSTVRVINHEFTLLQDTVVDAAEKIEIEPQILFEIEDKDEIYHIKLKL